MPLSLADYYAGVRTWDAALIPDNPFYHPDMDRESAILYVRCNRRPVLRPSSVAGYAVTYVHPQNPHVIVNTLLRHNGWAVQTMSLDGATAHQTFPNLYVLLDTLTGSKPLSGSAVAAGDPSAPVASSTATAAAPATSASGDPEPLGTTVTPRPQLVIPDPTPTTCRVPAVARATQPTDAAAATTARPRLIIPSLSPRTRCVPTVMPSASTRALLQDEDPS